MGDNGAGKSTLVKTISGVYRPDSGQYIFEGKEVTVASPRDATNLGIETVYQDLALCDNLDVVGNLYLGRETTQGLGGVPMGVLDEARMEQTARRVIGGVGGANPFGPFSDCHACRAGSARAWRWPDRSCGTPRLSCWTSPRPLWVSLRQRRC